MADGFDSAVAATVGVNDPDAVADSYWHLVEQDRSAWTLEPASPPEPF